MVLYKYFLSNLAEFFHKGSKGESVKRGGGKTNELLYMQRVVEDKHKYGGGLRHTQMRSCNASHHRPTVQCVIAPLITLHGGLLYSNSLLFYLHHYTELRSRERYNFNDVDTLYAKANKLPYTIKIPLYQDQISHYTGWLSLTHNYRPYRPRPI